MKTRITIFIISLMAFMNIQINSSGQIKIGVFADCQYGDIETAGSRFYRQSVTKLQEGIEHFNKDKEIAFVVSLGDLIDRNFESFAELQPILGKSEKKIYHVIGNHDLAVEKPLLEKVPEELKLKKTWYAVQKKEWRFIFLNGNDITFHSNSQKILDQATKITDQLKREGKPNYHDWNGGIGRKQIQWLEKELVSAQKNHQYAAVFCHYPLLPFEAHALWNSEEVLEVLRNFSCVKIYINGHNHKGNYIFSHGIHFVNLKGMVETELENAFAEMIFRRNQIELIGYGREDSRILQIR